MAIDAQTTMTPAPPTTVSRKIMIATAVAAPLLGCFIAGLMLWQVGWMGWLYLSLMFGGWLFTSLGITVGFHRMLSHRSFVANRFVRGFWTLAGTLAVEGSPLVWCAVHRRHHQCSDKEGDPHSPHLHDGGFWNHLKGFLHAHTGWLFQSSLSRQDMVRYVPDIDSDRFASFLDRTYGYWVAISLLIPAVIAGLVTMSWSGFGLGFLWGGLVRVFFTHHLTWSINSVCHVFGQQPYESNDASRNNPIFGLLSHGEGWHNNHHAFPTSARHGLEWWQFDLSWLIIRGMQMLGLAWDVKLPKASALEAKRIH